MLLMCFTRKFGGWGWEWGDRTNTRPIRKHSLGMDGQEIWLSLFGYDSDLKSNLKQRIENWLIWGYFEKNR